MKYKVTLNGRTYEVEVVADKAMCVAEYEAYAPAAAPAAAAPVAAPAAAPAAPAASGVTVSGGESVTAPMPGNILKVAVSVGQTVKEGDLLVVMAMGKIFIARDAKLAAQKAAKDAEISAVPVAPHTKGTIVLDVPAPGTAGQLKLHDVEPKTAAMIMAIVADKMGKPLNELRFISIKEVK